MVLFLERTISYYGRQPGGKVLICRYLIHHKVVSCAHIKAQYESQPRCSYEFSLYASLSPQNINALAFCGDPYFKNLLQSYNKKIKYANFLR